MAEVRFSRDFHQIVTEAVRPKLEKLARDIKSDAKRLCPIKTGDLVDTIEVEVLADGTIEGTAGDDSIGIDYAAHVEWGTQATAKRPWTTPTQPYMRPAFYENRGTL